MKVSNALKPHLIRPEHLQPNWRWDRAIPSHGHMSVDFERRIDFDRLRHYRLARARQALKASPCGALLLFDVNNIRYVSATKIGEWERDKLCRFALLAGARHSHAGGMPFVPGIRIASSDLIFVSGVIGVPENFDPTANAPIDPIEVQAERGFEGLGRVLAAAGAELGDVVRITKYMTDLNQHGAVLGVMRRAFGPHLPTSTTVEVKRLVPPASGWRLTQSQPFRLVDRRPAQRIPIKETLQ